MNEKDITEIIKRVLSDVSVKKVNDTPKEAFDVVNKKYLQQSGTTSARPTYGQVGRMYFNTTTNKPNWDTGSGWVNADGTAA